mmetsp:Transcript_100656/g.293361  ORF Transcript_100656/g.293361 Transcript_100656/m.293361 type:complete len:214 (-) Transcript_100656:134-775(-)
MRPIKHLPPLALAVALAVPLAVALACVCGGAAAAAVAIVAAAVAAVAAVALAAAVAVVGAVAAVAAVASSATPHGAIAVALAPALAALPSVSVAAAARHVQGLLLARAPRRILNVKVDVITDHRPAAVAILHVQEDISPLHVDEAPAFGIVEGLDDAVARAAAASASTASSALPLALGDTGAAGNVQRLVLALPHSVLLHVEGHLVARLGAAV